MAEVTQQIATLINGMNLSDEQVAQLTQNLVTLRNQSLLELDSDVAKAKEGSRVTRRGFDLLGKACAGKELHYTRVAFGDSMRDGALLEVSVEEAYELNNLINWKMDLPMADCSFTGGGTAAVKFSVQNKNIEQGFWIREIGLFAEDPDTGEEILYCYRNSGILSEYIPAGDGSVVWDIIMTIITVIDSATNVTAVIDANLAYVSQSEFNQHINSANPHPNIPILMSDVDSTSAVWSIDEDSNLHKISTENLAKIILGGDAGDIPKMASRLTQTEINIANLYMQQNAKEELGLQANLLLVEDFVANDACDLYECEVVMPPVATMNTIYVASDQGILAGCWYTLTDGVKSQYMRVQSVARSSEAYIVFFEQSLQYNFKAGNTRLMRSTALIANEQCQGAGDIRGVSYTFGETWIGSGGNVATTLTIDFTQANASAFTIDGDGTFTGGLFTLVA